METLKMILSALGFIGFGGLLKSAFDYFYIEDKKRKDQTRHAVKENGYHNFLLLSHILLEYEKSKAKLAITKPEIKSREELLNELKLEWMGMALYASDDVIRAAKKFLEKPSYETHNEMIFAMRKSLYAIKTSLTLDELKLNV
ncbi:MAG: hypothetical protein ACRCYO_05250 [Bacteroidia bacterium]